ncbi:uncharacterized protein PFL1_04010 [Pseudozyma flocculosa PF-1]|uniref:Related to FMP25 - mitochondrial inner membrane protein involved in assembly of cytochrome bc1 complex n=2 Tax=Pseudozyma flocculosa TaxID=84751 RepID=A0A5C3EUF6_9BASI|nr:uncharacterized protein PFL1_04010 [Pseudozyma flocculosa PF-1]EPQ28181.1 hypothetical protein PFL1_04010 [Pseudozyma flocculosa PF-1]SPO35315.1 related to FMP25 - mitochondrial inner membrane protein involved in assembly of cytochrome bc1 complex [Pseudozyma flocculosa]
MLGHASRQAAAVPLRSSSAPRSLSPLLRTQPHTAAAARGRFLHSRPSPSSSSYTQPPRSQALFYSVALGAGVACWWATSTTVHNDVAQSVATEADITLTTPSQQDQMRQRAINQGVYAWGSNRYNVVAPDAPQVTLVRSPRSIPFFDGVALRDIALEEKHGVAVDANGDVLQWGLGFFDPASRQSTAIEDVPLGRRREKVYANAVAPVGSMASQPLLPVRTLVGKDIVKVTATEDKVFALSKDGKVYAFSAVQQLQAPRKPASWSANPLSLFGLLSASTIDHEILQPAPSSAFASGERVVDVAVGNNHLLALSTKGRAFSMPINADGNSFGQLGVRRVLLNSPRTPDTKPGHTEALLEPKLFAELESDSGRPAASLMDANALPPPSTESGRTSKPSADAPVQTASDPTPGAKPLTESPASIRYCTTLHEIPALKNINIAQIAAGAEHSLARTHDGRVLAWGRQTHGQVGLGSQVAIECVPVPSEVVLTRSFPNSSSEVRATSIAAGGDNSFIMTTRREPGSLGMGLKIDLLAVGKGQWGTLGNAMWSQVASQPARVKTVSGLMEFSELTNKTHPVPIYSLSIGKPGHCALVLDTVEAAGHAAFGRDVMVWGANAAFQLGTGKRSNLAVPQHLKPLPPLTPRPGLDTDAAAADAAAAALLAPADPSAQKLREADIKSGALTHMPHNRLQLASKTKADTRIPAAVETISQQQQPSQKNAGKVKKNQTVEETIKAGTVSTVVFWKVEP